MPHQQSPGARLRTALQHPPLIIPGVFNALVARMAQRAGFRALYQSGAALSAGLAALPDVGLLTQTEFAQQAAYLTRAVDVPVLSDADTGFGEPLAVQRTVQLFEAAGLAGLHLEDQQLPKRCGHLSGKSLVSTEEMSAKLRAAADARRDPEFLLIARTDARAVAGLDEAITRARAYIAAGADALFPEALETRDEFARFAREVRDLNVPLIANMTEFGRSPLLPARELADLGYAAVLYPVTLLRIAMHAAESALARLAADGTQLPLLDHMQTRSQLYDLLDYEDYNHRDRSYFNAPNTTTAPHTLAPNSPPSEGGAGGVPAH